MNTHDQLVANGITPTIDAHKAYDLGRKDAEKQRRKQAQLNVRIFRPNKP